MSKKIVAITSCITGIAHTYMAAKALEQAAAAKGYEIHVEKQGANGTEDALTPEQIAGADGVIFAIDKAIDESRFAGKHVLRLTADQGIKEADSALDRAIAHEGTVVVSGSVAASDAGPAESVAAGAKGVFRHIMNGVSHMLPIVVAGGIITALSFAFGIYAYQDEGSLPWALYQMGASYGLGLMVPVLSAFIAQSVADRPGFVPGIIGGMIASNIGSGFIGGILAGLIAGYVTWALAKYIKLPDSLAGLKPIVILPLLGTLITGLLMYYVIGGPVSVITAAITSFLDSMSGVNVVLMGIIFGLLYVDLGGPVSKVLYAFAIAAVAEHVYEPMAAVMVCGMIPPLGCALATFIRPSLWSKEERDGGKAAIVLGFSYITEGSIPFATSHPLQVLPATVAGGMIGAVISLLMGVGVQAPHGGMFLLLIPGVITNVAGFLIALAAGTVVCALVMVVLMSISKKSS